MARGGGCGLCFGAFSAVSCVSGITEGGPGGGGGGASVICMTKPFVLPNGGNMSNSGKPALGFVVYLGLPNDIFENLRMAVCEAMKGARRGY